MLFTSDIQLTCYQVFRKLTTFFKSLGVKAVFDTSFSRDLVLVECCNEFVTRFNQSRLGNGQSSNLSLPILSSACPGILPSIKT